MVILRAFRTHLASTNILKAPFTSWEDSTSCTDFFTKGWHGLYVTLFVYMACAIQVVAVAFHEHYEPAQGASQHPGPADHAASAELLTGARSSRLTERLSLASLAEIDEVGAACCWSAVRRCVLEIEVVNHSNVALQARPPYQSGVHFACLESHVSHRDVAVHARPHDHSVLHVWP